VLLVAALAISCHGFSPTSRIALTSKPATDLSMQRRSGYQISRLETTLYNANPEKQLRAELADLNTLVKDEEKYSLADGELLDKELDAETQSTNKAIDRQSLTAKIERLTKPRWYPLFLAEKVAEIVEASAHDLTKIFDQSKSLPVVGDKQQIVILGTGWGAASYLKNIDTSMYDVTVISPRNYFLFTPMLAGASVGTVEYRSICEPIREINPKANYLEATATNVDPETKRVTCQSVVCDGNSCQIEEFEVNYDKLIVTVGAQTNTFGIPGVRENCCMLKQVEDARRIRTAIVNCFERANLPSLTDDERVRDLTFAVIGAGPTGIEFAAELQDFIEQDGPKYYPKLLKFVRIKVIEASGTVLAPFDKTLQEEAIKQLQRNVNLKDSEGYALLPESFKLTELLLDSSVKEVTENEIVLNDGQIIPYGIAVWAAGNGPIPLTVNLIDTLGGEQKQVQDSARGRLAIDAWMRVIGANGDIFSLGDCSCITSNQLPATAQVAAQQGEYLAGLMNKRFDLCPPRTPDGIFPPPAISQTETQLKFSDRIANFATNNDEYAKPFQFWNLGILAYTGGGSALAQGTSIHEDVVD
jgi:NADH dehydrogenase FAD-containing subunit